MSKLPTYSNAAAVSIFVLLASAERCSAQPGRGPTNVAVCPVVERETPATIRLVGTILPDKSAVIASEVSGPVAEFAAQQGQFLRKGDVICRVDPSVAKLRYDEAAAKLEAYLQKVAELEAGERPEELKRLKAAVDEAHALHTKAEFEKKRVDRLFKIGQSSEKEKIEADSDFIAASRRLTQATARHEMAVNGPRAEVIARAKFDAAAQKAIADRLERDWKKTEIIAPFDGFIVAKRTEVGEWIDVGGPVAEMMAVETVRVRVDVPESAIQFARRGRAVTVEIEALERTIEAKITRVIPRAETTARSFPVEIDLPNPEHALLVGMFVWARVPSGPDGKRLMVSKDAIVARGPSKQIYVVRPGKDGQLMAIPTPVSTGMEIGHEIEVEAAGLRAGDRVVCRGNERLYGPTPIKITGDPTTQPSGSSPPGTNSKK